MAEHSDTGFRLAIKQMPTGRRAKAQLRALAAEIDILKRCRSSHVVSYFGSCLRQGGCYILDSLDVSSREIEREKKK